MRATWKAEESGRGYHGASASNVSVGASVSAAIGGWDAISPLANMPPQNAIQLINWFPQPGWVEVRRGHLNWCDTGTGSPVESIMGYMGQVSANDRLLAASAANIFDVTTSPPTTLGTGYASDRWQHTNFAGTGGSFTYMVNGFDPPQYYQSGSITIPTITCSDASSPNNFINIAVYRSRIWFVRKDSTKAYYLPVDSIAGTATAFDVGNMFINGGYLQAIGTFSTDAIAGPTEYIVFLSSQGDAVVYNIVDPTTASGIDLRGRGEISQPVGTRCIAKLGNDLGVITLDGVLPLSQVLTYDKAQLIGASLTKNIRQAITDSVRTSKDNFGWSLTSYPRNTMMILNVPLTENSYQEQYVMNTITGAWCRFTGQYSNCWEVFLDKPYFGDNMGIVHIADESAGDENQTLNADMQGAWNYFQDRSRLKRWHTIRPNVTIDQTYPVNPQMGLNIDFGTTATLYPINFNANSPVPFWDSAIWDQAVWTGDAISVSWTGGDAIGWTSSIRITVSLPWDSTLIVPKTLKVNAFDYLMIPGAFI